jgi:hypothetical protein
MDIKKKENRLLPLAVAILVSLWIASTVSAGGTRFWKSGGSPSVSAASQSKRGITVVGGKGKTEGVIPLDSAQTRQLIKEKLGHTGRVSAETSRPASPKSITTYTDDKGNFADSAQTRQLIKKKLGSHVELNPQPLPPGPDKMNTKVLTPGSDVSLNPQPLPPRMNSKLLLPGSESALNPQPLPPKQGGLR